MAGPRKSDGKPNLGTNAACFACTIACGRISTIDRTHYTVVKRPEYQVASGGLEYEAAWALGAATGVDDLDALTFANFICNEQGFDPISFGATVGAGLIPADRLEPAIERRLERRMNLEPGSLGFEPRAPQGAAILADPFWETVTLHREGDR